MRSRDKLSVINSGKLLLENLRRLCMSARILNNILGNEMFVGICQRISHYLVQNMKIWLMLNIFDLLLWNAASVFMWIVVCIFVYPSFNISACSNSKR